MISMCDIVGCMVFNVTFNNILIISWQSVLLVGETRVCGENLRPVASHWQTWSHNVVSSTSHLVSSISHLSRVQTHNISGDMCNNVTLYWHHSSIHDKSVINLYRWYVLLENTSHIASFALNFKLPWKIYSPKTNQW